MTISTMDELEAVPVGTVIQVGSTSQRRAQNVWERVEGGFTRNGLTLPPRAFGVEVQNSQIRSSQGAVEVAIGAIWHRDDTAWWNVVVARATPDQGGGWWCVRFSSDGVFDRIHPLTEIPGRPLTVVPNWFQAALSTGTALHSMMVSRDSAQATGQQYRASLIAAQNERNEAQAAAEQQVNTYKDRLSEALMAYCTENKVKPDDPLAVIMRDNGLRAPQATVPVKMRLNIIDQRTLTPDQLREQFAPEGAGEYRGGNGSGTFYVYYSLTVTVPTLIDGDGCACRMATRDGILAAVREVIDRTPYSYEITARHCTNPRCEYRDF